MLDEANFNQIAFVDGKRMRAHSSRQLEGGVEAIKYRDVPDQ